jgi:heptosyltransferase-2
MTSMKIIVRMPNWIGDAVMALPALESLKDNFPGAEISLAAREWTRGLFPPGSPGTAVLSLPDVRDLSGLKEANRMLKALRFDVGLLLTNSFSSAFLFYTAGIPERWGYARDARGLLLTKKVAAKDSDGALHQMDYYLNLISGLGLRPARRDISLRLTREETEKAERTLGEAGRDSRRPLVVINPGAHFGSAKRWPESRFLELANLFQKEASAEILLVGSEDESGLGEALASGMTRKPLNFVGKTTLRELMGLISLGRVCVTNDSGPMHIANALKVPVVAIFGPTDPASTGPFQQPSVVVKKDVPCWPCSYRKCPYDHRCMMKILPEEVFEAARAFL